MQEKSTQAVLQLSTADEKVNSNPVKLCFDTGKPFQVTTPEGEISDAGKYEVECYLGDCGLPKLPSDFIWQWSTNRGTFPKRVTAYCFKEHKVKLTPVHVSELGNLARRHTSLAKSYTLDFTRKIDWRAGAFGDHGSCFWSDRHKARAVIEEHGLSVRGFRPYSGSDELSNRYGRVYPDLQGYSRAWVAPITDNSLIVFNGYGETSLTFARLLSFHFACGYKKISLCNNGNDTGILYINGDGYIVGHWPLISTVERYDLGWPEPECETSSCFVCDAEIDPDYDEVYYIGGYPHCENCVAYCDRCEEYHCNTRVHYFYNDNAYYCNYCIDQRVNEIADANLNEN